MRLRLFGGLRNITREGAIRNAFAGISLASMNIPQVLGYTRIASMPAVTGLYTVLLPLVAFAIFGSSCRLVVAADSATAAIFSSALSRMATPGSPHYMALVSMVALLTAGLLLIARIFKLGFLADFLPQTVLVGFLAGVGVQVGILMCGDMTGLALTANNSLIQAWELIRTLSQSNIPTVLLSLLVIFVILLGKRFASRIPIPLMAVLGAIAASAMFHFSRYGIADIGQVAGGLPVFGLPQVSWGETLPLVPVAASCFVMIIAQSEATARAFATRHREAIEADADILGLAAANAAAALSGTFVVNGSPTQTAMAERAGAENQFAQLVFAGAVLVVLLFLTGPLRYLPRCVLGAIVFTVAVSMIDIAALRDIRHESPGEFTLAIMAAITVVGAGVEQGILLAIALSLFRHVRHSYRPDTRVLIPGTSGNWVPAPVVSGTQTGPGFIIYRFGADLFYANYTRFITDIHMLTDSAKPLIRSCVVEASAITDIDFSAAHAIRDLLIDLAAQNVAVIFARVSPSLHADMNRHGITAVIGADRIFTTLHEAIAAAQHRQKALANDKM